jgi:hypothetical protein
LEHEAAFELRLQFSVQLIVILSNRKMVTILLAVLFTSTTNRQIEREIIAQNVSSWFRTAGNLLRSLFRLLVDYNLQEMKPSAYKFTIESGGHFVTRRIGPSAGGIAAHATHPETPLEVNK